ncbi:MAG: DUF423 domain-containing protein [Thermaurantimonas sp.]
MKNNRFLLIGLGLLVTGIVLGALGAHALKDRLPSQPLESFKTGVFYQLLHGVLFVAFGLYERLDDAVSIFRTGLYLSLAGVFLFSFSIYILSTSAITGLSVRMLGPVTPIGGVLMIAGWSWVMAKVGVSRNSQ